MGLTSALNTSVNGMSLATTEINVLGNNIANAGTTGFKQSNVAFATQLARTLSLGSAPTSLDAGTNPRPSKGATTMFSRSFSVSLSILAIAASSVAFAGCAADTGSSDDETESTLQSAEALSSESTASDPVEDAVVTDADADEASVEAADQNDGSDPSPLDAGCGLRQSLRERIKNHFDKNGDGKLDHDERQDLKDAIGGHPRMKLELLKIGVKARRHVLKRIVWAYDVDNNGSLDAGERAALKAAIQERCESRKERVLAKFDTNGDGKLDDGELREAIKDRVQARLEKLREIVGKVDTNHDGKLDDGERAAARAALKAHYMAKRDAVKAKFDVNGDGKLDDAELAALKAAIRARFEHEAPGE